MLLLHAKGSLCLIRRAMIKEEMLADIVVVYSDLFETEPST